VRPANLDDARAWAEVVGTVAPYLVLDAASEAHEMRTDPPGTARAVAVADGRVVGVARMRDHPEEEHASVLVMVLPDHRRRGTGAALLAELEPHVHRTGKSVVTSIVEDDDDSRLVAGRWGFRIVRTFRSSAVDPRELGTPPAPPTGVQVVPVADVGPHRIWEAHQQVARDDPSGLTLPQPYGEWHDNWADPRQRPDLGRAVLVDHELAAYTLVGVAGDRAWSDMTGTLPDHRGRGLALLAKQHALAAVAAVGVTRAMTGNDARNAPMVAVNRRLGYRLTARPALAERRS